MSPSHMLVAWVAGTLGVFAGWCLRVFSEPQSLAEMRADRDVAQAQLEEVYEEFCRSDSRRRQAAAEREAARTN